MVYRILERYYMSAQQHFELEPDPQEVRPPQGSIGVEEDISLDRIATLFFIGGAVTGEVCRLAGACLRGAGALAAGAVSESVRRLAGSSNTPSTHATGYFNPSRHPDLTLPRRENENR